MAILVYRRNMNNYYLKIADIKIHVKSFFEINISMESEDFISDYEDEDILLEYKDLKWMED